MDALNVSTMVFKTFNTKIISDVLPSHTTDNRILRATNTQKRICDHAHENIPHPPPPLIYHVVFCGPVVFASRANNPESYSGNTISSSNEGLSLIVSLLQINSVGR